MEGPPFGAFPWSAPGGTGQGSTDEMSGDGMLGGVSGSMNLVLPSPAAQPPASPGGLVWNAPGGATERGEFAQGFLWFDAQPDFGGWPVKSDSASAPLGGMLPPLPLPESFQQQQQQQQAFVPLDVLGQDTQQQQQQQQQLPITAGQPAAANGSRRGRGSGGGGRQAGAASRGAASEEERRARNRATQARFRERQKAKNEAALAEHAAAEAELERARQRQAMLRTHNSVLQNMLDAKDSMLGSLAAAAAPEAAAGVAALQPQPQQRLQLASAEHAAGAQPLGQQQQQQQRHEHRQPATDESNPPRTDGQAAAGGAAAAPATSAAGESSRHMGTDGEAGSGGGSGGGGQAGTAGNRPGGLSSSIQAHMEWLGRELTAQLAMLELPATADPDEAMALAHAQLAPMMEEAMPPRLKAHELLELQEHLANHQAAANAPAASSGSGTPGASAGGGSAAAAAPLQQQASTASTASGSAGGGDGGGPCASSLGASSERSGSGSQPVNLAELFRDKPDLVQHVMSMTAEELLEEWVNLARAFRSLLASYDAHRSAGDLEKILDIFRSWGGTLSLTLRLKPDNAQVLFATAGNAPPGTWEVAAGVLKPTPAQATMLRQLWHAYAGRAQTLRAERTAALQAVHTAAQQATACCGVGEAGTMAVASLPAVTLSGMTSQYLSLFDAAGKLSSLRDAEFITMLQLMGRVGAVFSPLQKARLVAACYPHFPDVVQVLRVLATGQVADGREQISRWLS